MAKLIIALWLGSCGADLASTHYVIAKGATESNPVLKHFSPVTNDFLVGGACAATAFDIASLSHEHKVLSWTLTIGVVVAHGWATAHNVKLAHQLSEGGQQ